MPKPRIKKLRNGAMVIEIDHGDDSDASGPDAQASADEKVQKSEQRMKVYERRVKAKIQDMGRRMPSTANLKTPYEIAAKRGNQKRTMETATKEIKHQMTKNQVMVNKIIPMMARQIWRKK